MVKADKAYIVGAVIKEDFKGLINYTFSGTPIEKKALATLKIAQLIDVAYGGLIKSEEQEQVKDFFFIGVLNEKLFVVEDHSTIRVMQDYLWTLRAPHFLAFRTKQQAEDFLKYNEDLIKDYYML